jgi:D-sedoheptulose 7-phosphate isomerase
MGDLAAAVRSAESKAGKLAEAAKTLAGVFLAGGTVHLCGNGGSAAESQHLAAELVGRFLIERPGLPAIALSTDTSKLTAIGNDYGFDLVFARQIRALGRPGDALWALSTSGTSPNVLKALEAASEAGIKTILMCGARIPQGVAADLIIDCPAPSTPRVQELHLLFGHVICALIDEILFGDGREGPLSRPGL